MIRRARPHDIEPLAALTERCRVSSGALGEGDPERIRTTLLRLMTDADKVVFRSAEGLIGGFMMPSWDAPGWLMAVEFIWWAEDGQWLPLLGAFERWARGQDAGEIRIASKLQPDAQRIARVFARRGYEAREMLYRKVL